MFDKVLIANRGEIACRIARTCRRLGIVTVAVFSDADADAIHVESADEAVRIGPAPAVDSYLNIQAIIDAALRTGAQAIHPGYGFLSESAQFAEICSENGIVFVGPSPHTLRLAGNKSDARRLMASRGISIVPGFHEPCDDCVRLAAEAEAIGYPLLVKAAAGGGGKGIRLVTKPAELESAMASARREAAAGFGDDRLLLEKQVLNPRHIEVQVFGDNHGNVVHLFERDCSLQRRYQKVMEETPAFRLGGELREALVETAVAAAKAADYAGAGTVEFMVDGEGRFYFMEINARLQVEHPVTEAVTGLDLVEWQLRVAAGEALPRSQQQIITRGHAVEARLYGEKPEQGFIPAAGVLKRLGFPRERPFLRIEKGVREGEAIGVHYDPLIAKIVATGRNRTEALHRLRHALFETRIAGIDSNREFLIRITEHGEFQAGCVDTGFIERHQDKLLASDSAPPAEVFALAGIYLLLQSRQAAERTAASSHDPHSPWFDCSGWWLNRESRTCFSFWRGGEVTDVSIAPRGTMMTVSVAGTEISARGHLDADGGLQAVLNGLRHRVTVMEEEGVLTVIDSRSVHRLHRHNPLSTDDEPELREGRVVAPIPGRITELLVRSGDVVKRGARLLILEAMKLEYAMTAPVDGIVGELCVASGDQVAEGDVLLVVEHEEAG